MKTGRNQMAIQAIFFGSGAGYNIWAAPGIQSSS
jgi:hypothetical protein